jgi:hypothetical protein
LSFNHHLPLFNGTPVEHLNVKKNDVKSRSAGAGFPVMNSGQAALRPTDSENENLSFLTSQKLFKNMK